ncbi:hypothetical protein [Nocardioides marmorisolisilvae]|nr:hypothetical protein [Nocardioides marmorisolisilvae]
MDTTAGALSAGGHAESIPKAAKADGVAPLRSNNAQLLQMVLFVAGAVLLPGGLVVIGLGWYGTAHTPYEYNQNAYLISGGILGLGITLVGGFLYFGSFLARLAIDQRESSQHLAEALSKLSDSLEKNSAAAAEVAEAPAAATTAKRAARKAAAPARAKDAGASLVVAGNGTTLHRADCDLIAGREDLVPAPADSSGLTPCRLCQG